MTESLDSAAKTHLTNLLSSIEDKLQCDGLGVVGPIRFGLDVLVRTAVESLTRRSARKTKMAVLLDTVGGTVEVVERIVEVIRHHHREVVFIVPDRAMSAGTVLAMSGDAIFMDYFSVLGPIDPQVERGGQFVPALAYLTQYDRLVAKSAAGQLTTAELVLLQKLDLAELQLFREARELSVELLKRWLVSYKFKDWSATSSGSAVTTETKERRAEQIANVLSDHERWHSHGRGISRTVLSSREINLKIDDLEATGIGAEARAYVSVLVDYHQTRKLLGAVHTATFF